MKTEIKIDINDDLQTGNLCVDSDDPQMYGRLKLMSGDSFTVYGCRYKIGHDCGDGSGATLEQVGNQDFEGHTTLEDLGDYAPTLEPMVMTVREYKDRCLICTGDLEDANGDILDDDASVTIFPDNTYCVGQYNGNQTTFDLI